MPTDVILPVWTMGMQEGTIVSWLKHENDHVEEDDELVEVEAEKIVNVVQAPHAGTLSRIFAQPGDQVEVLGVLCTITADDET